MNYQKGQPIKFLGIISFLMLSHLSTAQIMGRVVDSSATQPLEYATAALYSAKDSQLVNGVVTNAQGRFKINDIKKGRYSLKISFLGFETKIITDIEIPDKNASVDLGMILLKSGGDELGEVVVRGNQANVINKIDKQIFDATQFKNAQGGSATDLIGNLPSVTVDGLGQINVRGNSGFVVLLNGKPIQANAATLLNQLPANSIKQVELITAPSAKYDPEGKAGIINILTKKGAANGAFAQVNIKAGAPSVEDYDNAEYAQRYGVDATYNVRSEKWNFSIGANYQRNDLAGRREGNVFTIIGDKQTFFPSDGERSFDEVNYSGRFTLDYTPGKADNFSLGFYAGKRSKDRTADILYFNNRAVSPPGSSNELYSIQYFNENLRIRKGDFVLGSFDYSHDFADKSKLSASVLYEYTLLGGPTTNLNLDFPNTNNLLQEEFNTNDNPLYGFRFNLDYAWKPFDFGEIETGYQYRNLDHQGDFIYQRRTDPNEAFQLVPEFSSEVDLRRKIHSGYAQLSGEKGKWEYNAGARLEFMDREFDLRDKTGSVDTTYLYDFVKLYPSAALQYNATEKTAIKAAYSKRVARTTTFKMNPFAEREHSETLEQGDPELLPEFIDLVELGVTQKFKNGNSIYATAYFQNTKNLVNRVNTVYNDTILNRIYTNVGSGRAVGLDLGLQLKTGDNWESFIGANVYNYGIDGVFDGRKVDTETTVYSVNANSTFAFSESASLQFTLNYLSERVTAQGRDSRFYSPNLTFRKSFLDDRLVATLQWQNIDMGLLDTNEQRITTFREGEFYTTTNYVYEVDMVILNLSYTFNNVKSKAKFIESEFGKREF